MSDAYIYPIWCWSCDHIQDSQDLKNCMKCGAQLSGVLQLKGWNSEVVGKLSGKSFEEIFEELCKSLGYDIQVTRKYFDQDITLEYGDRDSFRESFEKINNGWEKIINHKDPQVRIAMTFLGRFLARAAVLALARDPSPEVRVSVIRNGCLFKEAVEILNQDEDPEVIDELKSSSWGMPGKYAFVEKGYWINEVIRHPDSPSWALEKVIKEFYDHSFVGEVRELPWHQNLPSSIFSEASLDKAWGRFFINHFINAFGYERNRKIGSEDLEQRKNYILNRLTKSNSVSEARDLLDRLMVQLDLEAHPDFAQHPLLNEIHLERLSRSANKKVREHVALRPDSPEAVLAFLAQDQEATVVRRVLENPMTPPEILSDEKHLRLANNRAFIARNPSIPRVTIDFLLQKKEERVLQNLALNEGLSRELVLELFEITPPELQLVWLRNPNLPDVIINKLYETYAPLTQSLSDNFYLNPNTSQVIRTKIVKSCSPQVLSEAILREEIVLDELRDFITTDFPQEVRDAALEILIANNHSSIAKLSFSKLEKRLWILNKFPDVLLNSSSSEVLLFIASNSRDVKQLAQLASNKDSMIKEQAELNLSLYCSPRWMFREIEQKEARVHTYEYGMNWL